MMTNSELTARIADFVRGSAENAVRSEDAIYPELAGMRFFDSPLVGFAAADDRLFTEEFKKEGVIHPQYQSPWEWLPGAKTVVSYFLPFTEEVRKSNRTACDPAYEEGLTPRCSAEWLHARIEGQQFNDAVSLFIKALLEEAGWEAVCPSASGNVRMITPYISDWSERHAAYAAGLGTFGLSKGLITAKGMAGRFGSVITNAEFEPTERPYSSPFEYCLMCGACMRRCQAGAIELSGGCALGKDQPTCGAWLESGKLPPHGPNARIRYGCGKCQTAVPCEKGIPGR